MANWALMGAVLSREEDTGFYRSYFKRILSTCPLVPLILGSNYL